MTRLFATAAALLTLGTSALAESPAQIEANKQMPDEAKPAAPAPAKSGGR